MTALFSQAPVSFAFGPFVLIPGDHVLLEGGSAVRLGRRAIDLLAALVQRQGRVVSKRELLTCVWPGLVVEEGNLKVNMAALRRALGEDPDAPRYVATVVGRGYQFIAPVQVAHHPDGSGPKAGTGRAHAPLGAPRIFGREETVSSILRDLEQARLISIVGPGGAGKTTVALAVADRAAAAFRGGSRFVDLSLVEASSPVSQESQVSQAITRVIGMRAGPREPATPTMGQVRDRDVLLILDNCEHLIGEVASCVDRVLACTRKLKIIITSREPISVRGERVRRLHGLGLPASATGLKAAEALSYPAVQMFVDRAALHGDAFRIDDANAPMVAAICLRLDGLALAIERVAQRVGSLGIAGLLEHLDRRFHMFDGYHAGPERHRTLTAAVDGSYARLSMSEQATMRRMAAFSSPFSLDAACAVSEAADVLRSTVIEDIASLVSKSLLTAQARNGEMLYSQTHVTRAYAFERLLESGEMAEARRRVEAFGEADRCLQACGPRPGAAGEGVSGGGDDEEGRIGA